MATPEPTPPRLLPRLIVLALMVALGQLWAKRHLGWGGDTPWIAVVVAVVTGADKLLDKVLSKERKAALEAQLRTALEPVLVGRFALLVCILAVLLAPVFSSVTVVPGSDQPAAAGRLTAQLSSIDGALLGTQTLQSRTPARFLTRFQSPFGHPYRLSVDGYIPETVTVYPFVGLTVTPDRDLRRSPSVLFRPSANGIATLNSGGTFVVEWRAAGGPPLAVVPPQSGAPSSFLIGRAQAIPPGTIALWKLDLTAAEVRDPELSQIIQLWNRPRRLEPARPLAPRMVLVAEVRSRQNKVVDRAEVELGTDALLDVPLLAVPSGG